MQTPNYDYDTRPRQTRARLPKSKVAKPAKTAYMRAKLSDTSFYYNSDALLLRELQPALRFCSVGLANGDWMKMASSHFLRHNGWNGENGVLVGAEAYAPLFIRFRHVLCGAVRAFRLGGHSRLLGAKLCLLRGLMLR